MPSQSSQAEVHQQEDQRDEPRCLQGQTFGDSFGRQQEETVCGDGDDWEPQRDFPRRAIHRHGPEGPSFHVESHFPYFDRAKAIHSHSDNAFDGISRSPVDSFGHHGEWKLQMYWNSSTHQVKIRQRLRTINKTEEHQEGINR